MKTRALGALTLTVPALLAGLLMALLTAAMPTAAAPPPPERTAAPADDWIGPGERFVVPGEPRLVVRLTRRALVVRSGDERDRMPLPAGPQPELAARPIMLGQAGEGWLLRQEGGDSTAWTLAVVVDGRLRPAAEPRRPSFDGGFRADGSHTRTWITRGDTLRSERTWPDGRRRVWSWAVVGPGEGGVPVPAEPAPGTLVATGVR